MFSFPIFVLMYRLHMRKAISVSILILSVLAVSAQPRSLGVRLGTECQLSYQHQCGNNGNFLQLDLGYELINLWNAAGSYDFMLARPGWTDRGEWGIYAGPALKVGGAGVGLYLAAGAQVGLEYAFEFPLQISIDVRPTVGVSFVSGAAGFYAGGVIFGGTPCISVRYCFGR